MDTSTSNYEKNCRDWQARFLTMDQERLLALIPAPWTGPGRCPPRSG